MPSLSIVRTDFKKILKWGGIILGVLVILFVLIKILLIVKEIIIPTPPPAPTVSFGKLPEISFPDGIQRDLTYELDTLTGELPQLPLSTKVYKMEERGPDILAVENASNRAQALGFSRNPQQISDFIYKWTNPAPPNQILTQNIKLDEFILTSSFLNYENQLSGENFTDSSEAIRGATTFLNSLDMYPEDVDEERTKVEFSTLSGGVIRPTTRVVTSNLATVYFFQKPRDDILIVYPQGKNTSMRLLIGAGGLKGEVLDSKFSHQNILDESGTYPIKTAEEAFENLKNGNAFISTYSGNETNVKIKEVYLALFSEGKLQNFLTPVIVFEGDDDFVAYVPAVTDEWIDK